MSVISTTQTTDVVHQPSADENDYLALNSKLALPDASGRFALESDVDAAEMYVENNINARCHYFDRLSEKLHYLVKNGYYDPKVFSQFDAEFTKALYQKAYEAKFRFKSFMGAHKFYKGYALKTLDGKRILERFEDRVVANAICLSRGDKELAMDIIDEMISRRLQTATPTFMNAGLNDRGQMVSCFLLNLSDNMESIARHIGSVKMLSKRGGGVAVCLTNLRCSGDPIKGILNAASGLVPVAKQIDNAAMYANQLGQRDGAAVVYSHMCHYDTPALLDTKRENADESIRIKTLSIGVVVPDVAYLLAAQNKDIYLFSPYDIQKEYGVEMTEISINDEYENLVNNPRIRKKKMNARRYFQTISYIQGQSGYPFIMNEDHVNRANPLPGRICMSNLCTEILQPSSKSTYFEDMSYDHVGKDISCNLASLNVYECIVGGKKFGKTVDVAVRALTAVSELSNIACVPSIDRGNKAGNAIGIGAMNLHGMLGHFHVHYDSPEAREIADRFFSTLRYYAIRASCDLAMSTGHKFDGFEQSEYASGRAFEQYLSKDRTIFEFEKTREVLTGNEFYIPTIEDWQNLASDVRINGMFNQNLLAIAPTGSISYINHSTASVHPIIDRVESRKEGALGRVYYPASLMTNENVQYFKTAYEYGWKAVIDMYAVIAPHIDQGCSLTVFMPADATTRDFDMVRIYAWLMGIKTLYYIRTEETGNDLAARQKIKECEACQV